MKKQKTKMPRHHHFAHVYQQLRYCAQQMASRQDGRMDRWKK